MRGVGWDPIGCPAFGKTLDCKQRLIARGCRIDTNHHYAQPYSDSLAKMTNPLNWEKKCMVYVSLLHPRRNSFRLRYHLQTKQNNNIYVIIKYLYFILTAYIFNYVCPSFNPQFFYLEEMYNRFVQNYEKKGKETA